MMNTVTRSGQLAILPLCSPSEPRPRLGTQVRQTPKHGIAGAACWCSHGGFDDRSDDWFSSSAVRFTNSNPWVGVGASGCVGEEELGWLNPGRQSWRQRVCRDFHFPRFPSQIGKRRKCWYQPARAIRLVNDANYEIDEPIPQPCQPPTDDPITSCGVECSRNPARPFRRPYCAYWRPVPFR
jgi:hypothetical protein